MTKVAISQVQVPGAVECKQGSSIHGWERSAKYSIRTERFIRALKYEDIYLNEYVLLESYVKAYLNMWIFTIMERPHQSLNYAITDKTYTKPRMERERVS